MMKRAFLSFLVVMLISCGGEESVEDKMKIADAAQQRGDYSSAVSLLKSVLQQNAANAEQSASSAEQMHFQASRLRQVVDKLVALVGAVKASQREADAVGTEIAAVKKSRRKASMAPPQSGTGSQVPAKPRQEVDPQQVIPLEDDSMAEF